MGRSVSSPRDATCIHVELNQHDWHCLHCTEDVYEFEETQNADGKQLVHTVGH